MGIIIGYIMKINPPIKNNYNTLFKDFKNLKSIEKIRLRITKSSLNRNRYLEKKQNTNMLSENICHQRTHGFYFLCPLRTQEFKKKITSKF